MNDPLGLYVTYVSAIGLSTSIYLRVFGKTDLMQETAKITAWIGTLLFLVTVIPGIASTAINDGSLTLFVVGLALGAAVGIPISLAVILVDRITSRPGRVRQVPDAGEIKIKVNGKPMRDNAFAFTVDDLSTPPPKGGFR